MMSEKVTVEWVRERVKLCDPDGHGTDGYIIGTTEAHENEDRLHQDVLRAISENRCDDPAACANEALRTLEFDYHRRCE